MTVAVSTDLGRVEELGVGLAAGTAAGMDVGTGSATDIRTDFGAAFERAGGSAALDQTLALPGKGTSEKLAIASVGSNARFAGSESIKANWQPMQRLWSGSAGSAGEPPEEVEGESDETKAGYETGGGLGGRSIKYRWHSLAVRRRNRRSQPVGEMDRRQMPPFHRRTRRERTRRGRRRIG